LKFAGALRPLNPEKSEIVAELDVLRTCDCFH